MTCAQAFRKAACVAEERAHGFTHSHNDEFNWCASARLRALRQPGRTARTGMFR